MTASKLVVHYRPLVVIEVDWEAALQDAADAVKADPAPVHLDAQTDGDALLHFLLYPASAHGQIADGDHVERELAKIQPDSSTRIVLVACQPSFPPLGQAAVTDLADLQLSEVPRKYAERALEPPDLQISAEKHMRITVRHLGISAPESDIDSSEQESSYSLLRFEVRRWRW